MQGEAYTICGRQNAGFFEQNELVVVTLNCVEAFDTPDASECYHVERCVTGGSQEFDLICTVIEGITHMRIDTHGDGAEARGTRGHAHCLCAPCQHTLKGVFVSWSVVKHASRTETILLG